MGAHKIIPGRLVKHLVKCRSSSLKTQYKSAINIKICQYDSSHHVHKSEMDEHLKQCPSAQYYQHEAALTPDQVGKKPVEVASVIASVLKNVVEADAEDKGEEEEEDWEKEIEGLNLKS